MQMCNAAHLVCLAHRPHYDLKIMSALKPIGRLHMTSHISRPKTWLTKRCNLCWKGIRRAPTFGVILKINENLIKNWNELLPVESSKTNKFDQNNLVEIRSFLG